MTTKLSFPMVRTSSVGAPSPTYFGVITMTTVAITIAATVTAAITIMATAAMVSLFLV